MSPTRTEIAFMLCCGWLCTFSVSQVWANGGWVRGLVVALFGVFIHVGALVMAHRRGSEERLKEIVRRDVEKRRRVESCP